jgi:hypothetical protein
VVQRNIEVVGIWVGKLEESSDFVGSMVVGKIGNWCMGGCIGLLGSVAGKGVAGGGIGLGVYMGLCCSVSGFGLGAGLSPAWCVKEEASTFVWYMAR